MHGCPRPRRVPISVAAATSAATSFGKSGGIIDHTEKQHRRAVHHVCTLFRYGLDERAVEQLPFRHVHLSDTFLYSPTTFSSRTSLSNVSTLECTSWEYL